MLPQQENHGSEQPVCCQGPQLERSPRRSEDPAKSNIFKNRKKKKKYLPPVHIFQIAEILLLIHFYIMSTLTKKIYILALPVPQK